MSKRMVVRLTEQQYDKLLMTLNIAEARMSAKSLSQGLTELERRQLERLGQVRQMLQDNLTTEQNCQ